MVGAVTFALGFVEWRGEKRKLWDLGLDRDIDNLEFSINKGDVALLLGVDLGRLGIMTLTPPFVEVVAACCILSLPRAAGRL